MPPTLTTKWTLLLTFPTSYGKFVSFLSSSFMHRWPETIERVTEGCEGAA